MVGIEAKRRWCTTFSSGGVRTAFPPDKVCGIIRRGNSLRRKTNMDVSRPPIWLMKTEPEKYSYADLARDGRTVWDGVRNNQAALYLKAMKVGDLTFIYHSVSDLAVVGVARVVREAFIDPTDAAGRFVAVEIAPDLTLPRPVPLADMKAQTALAGMAMFRQFRLSVSPVTPEESRVILAMGES